MINDIILKEIEDEFLNGDIIGLKDEWSHYKYKDFPVPRVTEILKCAQLSNEGLIRWANAMGFKHLNSNKLRDQAAVRGTLIHNAIEKYIKTGIIDILNNTDIETINMYNNAMEGFKYFWENFRFAKDIKNVEMEQKVVTPYFGGTFDLLITLKNGKKYLYDFKTTNYIKDSQFVQLSAYYYALREFYNTRLNGVGVLLVNKNRPLCEEYFIDFEIDNNLNVINQCENTFISILHTYYNLKVTDIMFNEYLAKYRRD